MKQLPKRCLANIEDDSFDRVNNQLRGNPWLNFYFTHVYLLSGTYSCDYCLHNFSAHKK